jgi:acetoin utilization protein AcuB
MRVKYWMTTEVITVDEDISMMKASKLMKDHYIKHLPVMKEGRLTGIVSNRDLKEAQPSGHTTRWINLGIAPTLDNKGGCASTLRWGGS